MAFGSIAIVPFPLHDRTLLILFNYFSFLPSLFLSSCPILLYSFLHSSSFLLCAISPLITVNTFDIVLK